MATPRCQIYLNVPPLAPDNAPALLRDACAGGKIACILFSAEAVAAFGHSLARELMASARQSGAAVLLENDAVLAEMLAADGLHVTNLAMPREMIAGARGRLGEAAVIGAHAGISRHDGMACGEAGADYVSFGRLADFGDHQIGPITDIVRWWAELIEIPCVAWHRGGWDEAAALISAGADFIAVDDLVWNGGASPREAIEKLHRLILDDGAALE